MPNAHPIPKPDGKTSLRALQAMRREKSVLAALSLFHDALGDVFRVGVGAFQPVFMVGADACHFVLVDGRGDLRWRSEGDAITRLLHNGLLVIDGDLHDTLRRQMNPALHKQMLAGYADAMIRCTDRVLDTWRPGETRDLLHEMRKIAMLIVMETLFSTDFTPQLESLWDAVIATVRYISPGVWMLWSDAPRPGFRAKLDKMDAYLYGIIRERRAQPRTDAQHDLLDLLISAGLDDVLIRDQVLTMIIAGHDTSTSLLAWAMVLLGQHPDAMAKLHRETDTVFGAELPSFTHLPALRYTGAVADETLRLYPPAHLGSRIAAVDLTYNGYTIPAGTRVVYSIYLTQRHKAHWNQPDAFIPERFLNDKRPEPYTWLPFGGGARTCIGMAFGQQEAKLVLARVFQRFQFTLLQPDVHVHMGAALEPRPGVLMRVTQR